MNKITATTPLSKADHIPLGDITISSQGYPYFYMPSHPLARSNGTVSLARHKASLKVGRWLNDDELVHRKDGDPGNTNADNLIILTRSEAMKENAPNHGNRVWKTCAWCEEEFSVVESHMERRHHCSPECAGLASRKFHVTPDWLRSRVWKMPLTQLGEQLGVSGNAVRKRCRKHGIPTPPRGYWALVRNGLTHLEALERLGYIEGFRKTS